MEANRGLTETGKSVRSDPTTPSTPATFTLGQVQNIGVA